MPEERNSDELDIVIIELGLIDDSPTKALSRSRRHRITGTDRNPEVIWQALLCGTTSTEVDDSALSRADLIPLCCYPQTCIDFVQKEGALFGGAFASDTCGVKGYTCPELTEPAREFGFTFVDGRSMVGKKQNDFAAGEAGLFEGANYLPIPYGAPGEAVALMGCLVCSVGATRTITTTSEHHDEMIAFTSQVPHALACAYATSPLCPEHPDCLAGNYRDVSRVVRINETLWSKLFLEDRRPLTREIDTLLGYLTELRNTIAGNSREALHDLLRRGRETKGGLEE